jgi:hypothetical protein
MTNERPKGIRLLRAVVWMILCPLFMYKGLLKRRLESRTVIIRFIVEKYPEYVVRSRRWLLDILEVPLSRIIKSASYFRVGAKKSIFGGRYRLSGSSVEEIRVLVRGIIESLTDIPPMLETWVEKIAKPFTFLPNSYMLPYERARLQFDYVGAVCHHEPDKRQMLITTFFITRVLVKSIMVDAHNISMKIKKSSRQAYNLRVVASVIQTLVLLAFADLGRFDGENHFIDQNEIL